MDGHCPTVTSTANKCSHHACSMQHHHSHESSAIRWIQCRRDGCASWLHRIRWCICCYIWACRAAPFDHILCAGSIVVRATRILLRSCTDHPWHDARRGSIRVQRTTKSAIALQEQPCVWLVPVCSTAKDGADRAPANTSGTRWRV